LYCTTREIVNDILNSDANYRLFLMDFAEDHEDNDARYKNSSDSNLPRRNTKCLVIIILIKWRATFVSRCLWHYLLRARS